MKRSVKDYHLLHVLKNTKCNKFRKVILKNCADRVIRTLSEILHNTLIGNIDIGSHKGKLEKFKKELRNVHTNLKTKKSIAARRKIFMNQSGGFIGTLLTAALSALVDYGVQKFIDSTQTKSE